MRRKVLLSGYYGFANAGDEAVLAGLLLSLREIDPTLEITVLSMHPSETQAAHRVRAVHRYRPKELLTAIAGTDVLLSGGGSLLQDVTSGHGILYYLGVVRLAQMLGKRTMFVAQGIGPLLRPRSRRLVSHVARRLDAITVRDSGSADLLREIGVASPIIEVTADPALLLGTPRTSVSTGTFGVALRPWQGQNTLPDEIAEACGRVMPEAVARLFPMQPLTDRACAEQFASRWHQQKGVVFCSTETGLAQMTEEIGACELMVGMRLHALILAAACGVPSVALAYDPKVAAFMAQSGQADAVHDLQHNSPDALAEMLKRCWSERIARAQVLQERLPALHDAAKRNAAVALSLFR